MTRVDHPDGRVPKDPDGRVPKDPDGRVPKDPDSGCATAGADLRLPNRYGRIPDLVVTRYWTGRMKRVCMIYADAPGGVVPSV